MHAQTELGAYSLEFLRAQRDWIMQWVDVDVVTNAHHAGELFSRASQRALYGEGRYDIQPAQDVYGTGTMRITEYYPALDLWKYKSNWGQHGWEKFYETV